MTTNHKAEPQAELIEQIEDLISHAEQVLDAEQVKGGFNPQPDPPKVANPVFQPPVIKPGLILPY